MTSEYVLKRDGTNVVVDSACAATSGTWFSPYDGATWTAASDVDIDHMVPLKNAWISGANAWTASKRTVGQARGVSMERKKMTDTVGRFRHTRTTSTARSCGL